MIFVILAVTLGAHPHAESQAGLGVDVLDANTASEK